MAPSILLLTLVALCSISEAATLPKFSGILIFGDSTVDTGNNNYVKTVFRSDHPPYGRDFPDHVPTGRFSNGKLIPDLAASILGMKETVPPFLNRSLTDDDIRTGVCFASAGSGYDDMTTAATGAIPLDEQLELFKSYITRLKGIVGEEEARKILGGALIIVSSGTNDLVYNYYDIPTRRYQFNTVSGYHDFLLNSLRSFVQELYNHGGRLMAIAGLPPIGCLPVQIVTRYGSSGTPACLEDQNLDCQTYNKKLNRLLTQLQPSLPGSRIIYADIYDPLSDMVSQPQKYGFVETHRGCCGTGVVEAGSTCNKVTPTCGNASRFMFWDAIHPSESAYKFLTEYLEKNLFSQFKSI
ncbi:GDSL esterase/lipase [Salix suchowensis]|nr:GDSL esterase/lipase [Salix suchowensis]